MKLNRIYAILLRHMYLFRRSYDKKVDTFYWVTLDLLLWGITGAFFQQLAPDAKNVIFMIISGVIFWNITYRAQVDISMGLLEELWNKNLINLFVSPLRFKDWINSLVIYGVTKAIISFVYASIVGYFLYKITILSYSLYLIPIFILLTMTGWWLGFMISGIILRYGTKVQALAWTLVWIISPFSAVFYPLNVLPEWVQKVSLVVPTSYVFEGAREVLATGSTDMSKFLISFVLNIIYILLSAIYLRKSFNKVLQKGLIKVY